VEDYTSARELQLAGGTKTRCEAKPDYEIGIEPKNNNAHNDARGAKLKELKELNKNIRKDILMGNEKLSSVNLI
jgi:hypothetical protein